MDAGWSPKCDSRPASHNEWGVLKTTSVQPLCFWPHENKALPSKLQARPEAKVNEGDILITRAGPKNRVGICCVAKSVHPYLMLSDKIIRFKIFGNLIYSNYCALSLNTGYGAEQIERMKSGMADSQMNISQDKVMQIIIALPPLPEQKLIVAKIDQLMALCDRLEQQINASADMQTKLLNAVMAQV
jgi:type I restriction enzyme S subunit